MSMPEALKPNSPWAPAAWVGGVRQGSERNLNKRPRPHLKKKKKFPIPPTLFKNKLTNKTTPQLRGWETAQ